MSTLPIESLRGSGDAGRALKAAEERWHKLRDAGDPGAAEAEQEFQRLARTQTEDLQQRLHQQMISRMLK